MAPRQGRGRGFAPGSIAIRINRSILAYRRILGET
jgi:hypothetical protein